MKRYDMNEVIGEAFKEFNERNFILLVIQIYLAELKDKVNYMERFGISSYRETAKKLVEYITSETIKMAEERGFKPMATLLGEVGSLS